MPAAVHAVPIIILTIRSTTRPCSVVFPAKEEGTWGLVWVLFGLRSSPVGGEAKACACTRAEAVNRAVWLLN